MSITEKCYPIVDCREDWKLNFAVENDFVYTKSYEVFRISIRYAYFNSKTKLNQQL